MMRRLPYILVYFLFLGVLFPAILYWIVSDGEARSLHSIMTLAMGVMVLYWSVIRLSYASYDCPQGLLFIVFYIFIYLWAGLAPLYQLSVGAIPWRIVLDTRFYENTYLLIICAIIAFEAGYTIRFNRRVVPGGKNISLRAIFIFSILAIMSALYFGPLTTSFSKLLSFREELADEFGEGPSRLMKIAFMRMPIYVALLSTIWKLRITPDRRIRLWILLLAIMPIFIIVNFPTAISRAWLGTIIISISAIIMMTSQQKRWSYFPLLICWTFFTIFPFMHRFRRAEYQGSGSVSEDIFNSYSRGDFDVFSMSAHFIRHLEIALEPITWGRQLMGSLFFFVPRWAWPDKPVGSGYTVAQNAGFPFLNVSAPFWSEGMINFGWAGVFIFMLGLGVFLKMLDRSIIDTSSVNVRGILFAYLSGFLVLAMRGDLMSVMTMSFPIIFSVFLLRMLR